MRKNKYPKECGSCLHNHAGDGRLAGKCLNKAQPNKNLKRYVYWNVTCSLWTEAPKPGPVQKANAKLSRAWRKAWDKWIAGFRRNTPKWPAYR